MKLHIKLCFNYMKTYDMRQQSFDILLYESSISPMKNLLFHRENKVKIFFVLQENEVSLVGFF